MLSLKDRINAKALSELLQKDLQTTFKSFQTLLLLLRSNPSLDFSVRPIKNRDKKIHDIHGPSGFNKFNFRFANFES